MEGFAACASPLLYAHRGARLERPENSLEAFTLALELGADALEIDVHMTRDGHPVIAHDPDGRRMAGVARAICDCTLSEVERWDIGHGFESERAAVSETVRMPTLDRALAAFPTALFNIDVKQARPDMLEPLLAVIARHGAEARVLLTSFSSAITRRIRALGYPGAVGLGRAEAVCAAFVPEAGLRRFRLRGQRLQVPLAQPPFRLDRARLIRKMHALGIAVDYWVVNDVSVAARLLALGADGIVSDDPRTLAQLYAHSSHTAAWRARRARQHSGVERAAR